MDLIAKAVTLKSIKLSDPAAKKLLFSAKHSVLYSFDSHSSNWEKTETEGCLAIYKQANSTGAVLFILNRLRPENFSCPVSEIESVQLEGDLLMLLLRDSRVMGIWLFDEKERHLALTVLESIQSGASDSSDSDNEKEETSPTNSQPAHLKPISVNDLLSSSTSKPEKTPNILDILSKAKIKEDQAVALSSKNVKVNTCPLENAILSHFASQAGSLASLKSFTSAVCKFLQENPQQLAAIHRKLLIGANATESNNSNNSNNK